MRKRRVLALIPARGGSKGIPHKNIYMLNGKPLIYYTIKAALQSKIADDVIVSTDDLEIAEIAEKSGALTPFLRPAELADDDAKTIDVVLHALDYQNKRGVHYDILILLQPTSPLRNAEDIKGAFRFFMDNGCRSLLSVHECASPLLMRSLDCHGRTKRLLDQNSTMRRQDMEKYYCVNGAIYINCIKELSPDTSFNDNEHGYMIEKAHGLDIDEMDDIKLAQYYMGRFYKMGDCKIDTGKSYSFFE